MSKPTITAYLKPWCGWSAGVRAVFKKYDLAFEERDIINRPEFFDEMVQKTGQTKQPTVEINGKVLADVSGEEVEAWMLQQGIVNQRAKNFKFRTIPTRMHTISQNCN
ncbi:MAG: glutaredoxin [Proteobacteria bacterium]|nr:glutaredoxin [Pseudomonadota bacterium]